MNKLQWKRVYETPENNDGYRILVDRLWPRGLKKENVAVGEQGFRQVQTAAFATRQVSGDFALVAAFEVEA